ncbi:hypothetical protein [Paracoccus mutanolyticus]|uniref:hypothetical protein n=1 Tax=Paracoccus mutanolyticus TaxID=1499308 RepID=UPI0011AE5706|nr:hypothetical protein [Paracoccus mutanolyticus]
MTHHIPHDQDAEGERPRILIVDDIAANLTAMRIVLAASVRDRLGPLGSDGWRQWRQNRPHDGGGLRHRPLRDDFNRPFIFCAASTRTADPGFPASYPCAGAARALVGAPTVTTRTARLRDCDAFPRCRAAAYVDTRRHQIARSTCPAPAAAPGA